MSLFSGLKEKLADKLAEFKASTTPQDPLEKQACELVDKATSDGLIAPDWTLNLTVVDFLNRDVRLHSGRVTKAIKRSLSKHNTKVQLLTLTLLETCVKNSTEDFHAHLAASELWDDVVKLAGDTSITRVDAEVRDKMLGIVEDFARGLKPAQYQATYENLLDKGVDFPVRAADEAVPILTPPAPHAAQGAVLPAETPAVTAGVPVGAPALAGGDGAVTDMDPLAGVDEQDRAAIQAALAELEAEAQAAREAERIAAEADADERRLQRLQLEQEQQQQQQAALLAAQEQQHAQQADTEAAAAASLFAAAEATTAAAATTGQQAGGEVPVGPGEQHTAGRAAGGLGAAVQPPQHEEAGTPEERTAAILETASNTTLLLSEMLASVPETEPVAVREPYVAEVADACVRLRSRLERQLETLADETLMASALSQHEELTRVLSRYDELLAAAEAVAPTVPRNAAAAAMAHAGAGQAQPHGYGYGPGQGLAPQAAQGQGVAAPQEPMGQKVAQTAAGLAAVFKEKFTGALDMLMAATARGPVPPGTATTAPSDPTGSYMPPGYAAPGGNPGGLPGGDPATGGNFTLEDEEDANEGTSLITRRAPAAQEPAPQWTAPPAVPEAPQQQHDRLASLVGQATSAPAQPAAAIPDLIDFGDEQPEPPAALAVPTETAAAAAVAPPAGDQPSGLDVHRTPGTAAGMPPLQALPEDEPAPFAAGPPPGVIPGAAPVAGHSRGPSQADQLVEALDRLVAQASVGHGGSPSSGGAKGEGTASAEAAGQQ